MSNIKSYPVSCGSYSSRLRVILWCLIGLFASEKSPLFGASQCNFTTYANGIGNAALFYDASGVVVDGAGNIIVADFGNHTIRKITPTGTVSTIAGLAGAFGIADGLGGAARFNGIGSIAIDGTGNVYALVATAVGNSYVIAVRKITASGEVSTVFQSEVAWGIAGAAPWWDAQSFAVDASGNFYLHDSNANRICKILPNGTVTILCSGTAGNIQGASGMTVDRFGNVYVLDWQSAPSKVCKISPAGEITPVITPNLFGRPEGVRLQML